MDSLGKNLRLARHRRGWTQAQAAEKAGVSPNTWARWERSEVTPLVARLETIAKVLGVSLPSLFTGA